MSYVAIGTKIKEVIESESELIDVVYETDVSTFSGYPAATVSASDREADYGSTARDKVTYAFKVRVYNPMKNEADQVNAQKVVYAAIDELFNIFKTRNILGTVCDWVEPVPGVVVFEQRGEQMYRMGELTLRCIKHVPNV